MTNNTPDYEDNLYFDSQDTKNEQQKDLCITSEQLTEQWKKGELPDGHYYCKLILNNMKPSVERCKAHCIPMGVSADKGEEVLAPVPSYDEWKEKNNALTALLAEYGKLTKELQDEKEKHMTRISLRSPADEMVIGKQVWESTLNRSMVLQAENEQLKEALKDCQEKILLMDYDSIIIEILQKIDEALK